MHELKIIELLLSEDPNNRELAKQLCDGLKIDITALSNKYGYSWDLGEYSGRAFYQKLTPNNKPPLLPSIATIEVIGGDWDWRMALNMHIGKIKSISFRTCKFTILDLKIFQTCRFLSFVKCSFPNELLDQLHTVSCDTIEVINCNLSYIPLLHPNTNNIWFAYNKIKEIPEHLPPNLFTLLLPNNKISKIPENIAQLLPNLGIVNLSNNLLTDLPPIIFSESLYAVDNKFPYDENGMWKPDWLEFSMDEINYHHAEIQFQKTKQ